MTEAPSSSPLTPPPLNPAPISNTIRNHVQSAITPGAPVKLSSNLVEPKLTLQQQAASSLNALGRTLGRGLLAAGAVIGSPLLGPLMILEATSLSESSQKSIWSELKRSFDGGAKDIVCSFKIFAALWSAIPSPFSKKTAVDDYSFELPTNLNSSKELYSQTKGVTSFTVTTSTLLPHNPDIKPAGHKQAVQIAHGKKESETELEILGVSASSVRAASEQRARYNPEAKILVTEEVFGTDSLPDGDVMVNFSDIHFGGVIRSASSFALEEILIHCSSQLLALQESKSIPLQREGVANAGQGKSHASSIRNVQFEIEIDTRKEVKGPDGTPLGSLYGNNAGRIFSAFGTPEKMAEALIQQGVIKTKEPPVTKTVVNQVAPTLALRAASKDGPRHATREEVEDYFYAVDAGMEALVAAKQKDAKSGSDVYYPAGWFGAGAFSNPGQLAALTQLSLAAFRGIHVVFHNVAAADMKVNRTKQLDEAQQLFVKEILPLIQRGATKSELLSQIQKIASSKKWPIGDLSLD